MHRQLLLELLQNHQPFDANEETMLQRTRQFVLEQPLCFQRELLCGHVTGSAWVVSEDRKHALLIHHAKLNRWFQPGGHCDGESDVLQVAWREAREETGLQTLKPIFASIFDVDVHWIPERATQNDFVPSHWHYDVRFLLQASREEPLRLNPEIKALRWVSLEEMCLVEDESLRRMARKTDL